MNKSHWFVQFYTSIQQRCLTTTPKRTKPTLMSRLKKQRSDLNAIMEPRRTLHWAQKVLQSRWKAWIYASKARYLSTSLFDLDAKQYNDLARSFVKAGSSGQLASCHSSSILVNGATQLTTYEELVDTIDRRLMKAFYNYALPHLSPFMQKLKMACQFSPITWFPQSRSLTRSIHIHLFDSPGLDKEVLQDILEQATDRSTVLYCGKRTAPAPDARYTTLMHLDHVVRQTPDLNTLILEMEGLDWRWTRAFLNTPASTVHVLLEKTRNTYGLVSALLKRVSEDRGDKCKVMLHQGGIHRHPIRQRGAALESWQHISPGDCIVVGSRHAMMDMKDRLEHLNGLECAVLFPQLPQVIQLQQINAFHDTKLSPHVLLMSDEMEAPPCTINAKRLLIKSIKKQARHGKTMTYYSTDKITRIANMIGHLEQVMVFDKADIPMIRQALVSEAPSTMHQFLRVLPSKSIFEPFCSNIPGEISMSSKMDAFEVLTDVGGDYMLDDYWTHQKTIANWLEHYSLSFDDRWTFMNAPVDVSLTKCKTTLQAFGEAVSQGVACNLNDVLGLSHTLPMEMIRSEPLMTLVNHYEIMQWYSWFRLQYPDVFVTDETVVRYYQEQHQTAIMESLSSNQSQLTDRRRKARQRRQMEQVAGQLLGRTLRPAP